MTLPSLMVVSLTRRSFPPDQGKHSLTILLLLLLLLKRNWFKWTTHHLSILLLLSVTAPAASPRCVCGRTKSFIDWPNLCEVWRGRVCPSR